MITLKDLVIMKPTKSNYLNKRYFSEVQGNMSKISSDVTYLKTQSFQGDYRFNNRKRNNIDSGPQNEGWA
jgi:hypothetical protein